MATASPASQPKHCTALRWSRKINRVFSYSRSEGRTGMKTTRKRYSADLASLAFGSKPGCAGGDPEGFDAGGAGRQARHSSHDDCGMEAAGDGWNGATFVGASETARACGEAVHADRSISAQCRLLWISRFSFYCARQPESDETLAWIAGDRRGVPRYALVWQPADGSPSAAPGREHRPPAGAAVTDEDGAVADLPAAADQRSAPAAPDLPLSAAASADRAAEPGLVCRLHFYPDAARLPLPNGDQGRPRALDG